MKKLSKICFIMLILSFFCMPHSFSKAAVPSCTTYSGRNLEAQDYDRWTSPITSYLSTKADGTFMRVQYGDEISGLLAEYYDANYNLTGSKIIPKELPLFGGFYETDKYYFIVSGQENKAQNNNLEVYRITKYDKNWTRMQSVGLNNCNTTVPFDAGTVRMTTCNDYLLIHTSHEMYTASDGKNHQANVTIEVQMSTMKITDSRTNVSNSSLGYSSHSFNQFIQMENNRIVTLDHGDAHPRSVVVMKYPTDVSKGTFNPSYQNPCKNIDVLTIPGATGENITGLSLGGFELSASSYLVAGNSVIQDSSNLTRKTRNIFVSAVNKETSQVTTNQITTYAEGEVTTNTPHLVKLSDKQFILLWSRAGIVFYTKLDDKGNKISDIYQMEGFLSDCVPVQSGNKLIWYAWNDKITTFYEIMLNNLSEHKTVEIKNGHDYTIQSVTNGRATYTCNRCHASDTLPVLTSFVPFWNTAEYGQYSSSLKPAQVKGNTLYYWMSYFASTSGDNSFNREVEVFSSNPSVITVIPKTSDKGKIIMKDAGTATITFRPPLNPALTRTFSITVTAPLEFHSLKTSLTSPQKFGASMTLTASAKYGSGNYQYRFYMKDSSNKETLLRDYSTSPTILWTPATIGTYQLCVDIKDSSGVVVSGSIEKYQIEKADKAPNIPNSDLHVSHNIMTLGDITLPDGWTWVEKSSTALSAEKECQATAVYQDTVNYNQCRVLMTIIRDGCSHQGGAASCSKKAVCELCKKEYGFTDSTVHLSQKMINQSNPTSTTDGYSGDLICEDCHTILRIGSILPASEHSDTNNPIKDISNPVPGKDDSNIAIEQPNDFTDQEPISLNETYHFSTGEYKFRNNPVSGEIEAFLSKAKGSKTLEIPETLSMNGTQFPVTFIDKNAFRNNKKIKKIIIGKNIKSIASNAFYGCKNIKTIIIKSRVLTSVGKNAIKKINRKAVIKVPKNKKNKYKKLFTTKTGYRKTMKVK